MHTSQHECVCRSCATGIAYQACELADVHLLGSTACLFSVLPALAQGRPDSQRDALSLHDDGEPTTAMYAHVVLLSCRC